MNALLRHWPRIAITLLPVVLALAHVVGVWHLAFLDRLDHFIYDVRLRASMPRTLDPRIVIVDIDDPSLQREGHWPWGRDKLARLTTELVQRQQAAVVGFDVLFVEPDANSGFDTLRRLSDGLLRDQPAVADEINRLASQLDHDSTFARSLSARRVVLGFYLTQTAQPRAKGRLPGPVLLPQAFQGKRDDATRWNGFAGSIPMLAEAAPVGGFLNVVHDADQDGIVRSVPLIARYDGTMAAPGYYESLALAAYRMYTGSAEPVPVFAPAGWGGRPPPLEALLLGAGDKRWPVPVDEHASLLVPYRGPGGARGGSFRYIRAADVLDGQLAPAELKNKIVLIGATSPGLADLHATPVDAVYPGVEVHANLIAGLLDQRLPVTPDYAPGYELVIALAGGLLLAFGMSLSPAPRAIALAVLTVAAVVGLDTWLYLGADLVLPLASFLAMAAVAFVLNMSWGYFVEARSSRSLASLFGTYVPPQLVDEMRAAPRRYSMRAESKVLTVMFCDMRGFTRLAEQMAPVDLQAHLNEVFSTLTEVIARHRGTVDKYMGDCVMAFWGAPVEMHDHAELAVRAALDMIEAVRHLNEAHRRSGRPQVGIGIGLNSGAMSVGDMGSAVRRSYTVVGDAVNLAARLEGLGVHYGVDIVASEATRHLATSFAWQELDSVRVQGKAQAVRIYSPLGRAARVSLRKSEELLCWSRVLSAYRAQEWGEAQAMLAPLHAADAKNVLYQLYAQRVASMASQPKDPDWDGSTRFETK